MSLGQNYNNNKKDYSPTVYSAYKMNNGESKVDPTSLSFTFWNSMLKISVSPRKQTNGDEIAFDHENAISIYLSHSKARIFHMEILRFLENPEAYDSVGVNSGQGLIMLTNGKEFGVSGLFLVVMKINDQGIVQSSYAYEFKTDFYYSVRNFNSKTADFDKCTADHVNTEILQLMTLLETYYTSMSNAMAYSVLEQMKYDTSRTNTKLELIADKLGVQFGKGNNNYKKSSQSIFNKKPASDNVYNTSTIDDITSQFED